MENESEQPVELQLRDVGRVEAFSDGVFAFAVTLLVLAIPGHFVSDARCRGLTPPELPWVQKGNR